MPIEDRSMKTRVCLVLVFAFAWFCPLLAEDWQKGEPILPAAKAPADAPLRRNEVSPWYELSNLRRENTRLVKGGFLVDYKRVGSFPVAGFSDIVLVSKGAGGRQEYRGAFFGVEQGTINLATFGGFNQPTEDNLEVWLECKQRVGTEVYRIKVSRSLTLGSVGQRTYARDWNADEQRAFELLAKSFKPPEEDPPATYRVATRDTKLLPGMPVLAGSQGQWVPAEIIDVRADGSALLNYSQVAGLLLPRTRDWIAVDEATLAKATANPGQFKPSVRVVHGGSAAIPDDHLVVDASAPIVKGTPLKADRAGQWHPVTVLDVFNDGALRIRWDGFGGVWEEIRARDRLLITADTLAALNKPNAAELFASRAERPRDRVFETLRGGEFGKLHDDL
jgi:hypothetical protein